MIKVPSKCRKWFQMQNTVKLNIKEIKVHSLSITNTCDGQTCKIRIKNRSQLNSYEFLYNTASCKWNGDNTTKQRATIKHVERYTNITVTKIMLVSVICLVLHNRDEIHSGFSNAVLFKINITVTDYLTSFPSIILHFEHMKHDPHEDSCQRQSTCRSCFFIQEMYTVQSDPLQEDSLMENRNRYHALTASVFSLFADSRQSNPCNKSNSAARTQNPQML